MKLSLLIVKCTESSENKGVFYTKLVHKTIVKTEFGDKEGKSTFYVKGTKEMEVGTSIEVDMNQFDIVEHISKFADERTGEQITRNLKWLHVKGLKLNVQKDAA